MADKDKIIIVCYIGVKDCCDDAVVRRCTNIADWEAHTKPFDDTVKFMIVPRKDKDADEIWLECINPQLVSEEKYKEAEETVEKIKKLLEDKI